MSTSQPCNCEDAQTLQAELDTARAEVARLQCLLKYYTDKRAEYVRQHAPGILAGYLTQDPQGVSDGQIREQAIRTAGLLFDECGGG